VLLEPVVNLTITVPEANTGDVMGDLNGKRAKVLGMTPQDGSSVIEAQAPLGEVLRYATDLRSITQGRGSYRVQFSHYEEIPTHVAQRIVEHYRNEGYVRAQVGQPEIRTLEDARDGKTRWIQLRIPVTEGARYRVGEFAVDGNKVVRSEAPTQEAARAAAPKPAKMAR